VNIAAIYPIKPPYHDPNVSLVIDGEVVFAYEEEKLSRRQREYTSQGYPSIGLYGALKKTGLRPDQIDLWALVGTTEKIETDFMDLLRQTKLIHFVPQVHVRKVPHHLAHAALSVLTSPFEECIFASMDGGGDDGYAVLGTFSGNGFQEIHRSTGLHLANFWSDMTHYLGFKQFEEGKLMGLAAYGHVDEKLYRLFRSFLYISEDGLGVVYTRPRRTARIDMNRFDWDNFRLFKCNYPQFDLECIPYIQEVSKIDIAATIQRLTEDYVAEIVANLVKRTGLRQLAVSGGLFQNVKLNGILNESPDLEAIHVPIAAGDAGLSLGAALFTSWEKTGKKCSRIPLPPCLGPAFDHEVIEREIRTFGLKYRRSPDIAGDAARLIADGKVVGWFQNAGEYGPRALGSRSVLADPRNPQAKARVNQLLKKRDWFMPYAPSILEEHVGEYFHKGCNAPYMSIAFRVREEKAASIPAAVHVDGTSRPQTVTRELNGIYYRLIEEFHAITGVPLVLNTSFNRHGLPTICTPKNALEHLCLGCVDVLAIGDFLVEREFTAKEEARQVQSEPRMVADLKVAPVLEFALAGNAAKALEICGRLGVPGGNGIGALIRALAHAPDKRSAAMLLRERLAAAITTSSTESEAPVG
jgi:carbamoyltransferase